MKILALTTGDVDARRVRKILDRMDLGPSVDLELLTVRPPRSRVPVARVDCVDPSVVPFRPVIPVSGPAAGQWGGMRRVIARVLRVVRRLVGRIPLPSVARVPDGRFLEIACATSSELRERAQQADVVVALDLSATRAAWRLAHRSDHPVVVWGAKNVRRALERYGRPGPATDPGDGPELAATESMSGSVNEFELVDRPHRLLIAPANYAGQGGAWAAAVREHLADATAMSMRAGVLENQFPVDYLVDRPTFAGDLEWRLAWRDKVLRDFTHVIVEANLPIFGKIVGEGDQHVTELLRAGKHVAYLSHGSDARIPSVHAERERWHSYDALPASALDEFEHRARRNVQIYNSFSGTVFVSTPGLLEFVPNGVWLPVVVSVDDWRDGVAPLQRERPVVAHIPSSAQKGSHLIDPILRRMHENGQIQYLRAEGIPHEKMPDFYRDADIMVEQFGIADYSVAACEAMAAGRVVVSRVADAVRERVRRETGFELPIVEANPETLEQVILEVIADPEGSRAIAKRGEEFVAAVHDGRRSAAILDTWLSASSAGHPSS